MPLDSKEFQKSNETVYTRIYAEPSQHCNHSMLQNDKINCNGSFRDITMYFVKDPCVNVSILWIIIMYHVKPSCCSTSKIHRDMSNFWCTQKHLEKLWHGGAWKQSRRMATALLPRSQERTGTRSPRWKPVERPFGPGLSTALDVKKC